MGSFNTSCFITRNSIGYCDPVVIFPIVEHVSGYTLNRVMTNKGEVAIPVSRSTCHSTAYWRFRGEMLYGRYDDCGLFSLDETAENDRELKSFVNALKNNMPHGDFSLTDEIEECSSLYQAWNVIQEFEPDIYLQSWAGYPSRVRWAVCSRHAFDAIMADIEENPSPYDRIPTWQERIEGIKEVFHEIMDIMKEVDADSEKKWNMAIVSNLIDRAVDPDLPHFTSKMAYTTDFRRMSRMFLLNGETEELAEEFNIVFGQRMKLMSLCRWLDEENVTVLPHAYAGQDRSFNRLNRVCEITTRTIMKDNGME